MWARLSTYQLPSGDIEGGLQAFKRALGDLDEPGLRHAALLVDRTTGKALTITIWHSEESLRTTASPTLFLNRLAASTLPGVTIIDVSHYEIVEDESPEIHRLARAE